VPNIARFGTGPERARVAIVGCGGAGCNTLRHVVVPPNAERIAVNDEPHPSMAGIPRRVFVRPDSLRAFATMDERAVQKMETHEEKDLATALLDRDVVLVLTVPFTAEGMLRRETAEAQIDLLRTKADGVVAFSNDHLLRLAPDLPIAKSFAVLGAIMARAASGLAAVVARDDVVPIRRFLARSRDWRFGIGTGTEKHRCFVAVDEAYRSPWFTGRHGDIRQAVVIIAHPASRGLEGEILHEIHLRSPLADLEWAADPRPTEGDRVVVQILAGLA